MLAAGLLEPAAALATPRYSAQYGQKCNLCHINPTGGGMRTLYASQYLVPTEMAMMTTPDDGLEGIRPDLSEAVTVGVDLRTLLYEGEDGRGSVVPMQSDVYLHLQMNDSFAAAVEQGRGGTQEVYGLAYVLPADGYLKAGSFTPAYGWRFADHQQASRKYLLEPNGSDYPSQLNAAAVELGFHHGPLVLSSSLLGGTGGNGDSYAARVVLRHNPGPLNLALGASVLRRQQAATHRRAVAGFGYLALGPVTWLWQVDETGHDGRLGRLVSNELAVTVRQGFDLRAVYSFQDPDRALKNGSRSRYGAGFDTLITPFFGILAQVVRHEFETGVLVDEQDYTQTELVLHFLY